jgi:hypothetical protein
MKEYKIYEIIGNRMEIMAEFETYEEMLEFMQKEKERE